MVEIGSIRPSQLISSFGPGSLVNLEYDTVLILGLQFWPRNTLEKKYFKKVIHPYLSRQLEKSHFRMPISNERTSAIPCISFPQWAVCQNCNRLQKHAKSTNNPEGFMCQHCDSVLPLYHATFVQICDNGHLHEFPWDSWAHRNKIGDTTKIKCTRSESEAPKLEFFSTKQGTNLSNYKIKCLHCEAERNFSGATDPTTFARLGFKECFKQQPWLAKKDSKICDAKIYGIQVNSSSIYYPSVVSSILIPAWIHEIDDFLDRKEGVNFERIRSEKKEGKSYDVIFEYHKDGMLKDLIEKFSKEQIIERLKLRLESPDLEVSTEGEALEQEFDNYSELNERTRRGPDYDLKVDIEPISIKSSTLSKYNIDKLMKFHRLLAIQVLRGFTRGTPPDPYASEKEIIRNNPFRPISSGKQRDLETGELLPIDWLPAVETKGEGLFFKFDENALQNWEARPNVKNRFNVIVNSYAENSDAQNRSEKQSILRMFSSPRYLMLHTFAHILIREISFYAGYNEASLKERVYSTSGKTMRNGILIYTSSSSSEGSLGGLVRLGNIETFEELIENAIKRSNSCSRDPICGETNPVLSKDKGISSGMQLSGSSCYSCTLLPETSCQNFNNLLDRWMLRDPKDGFFRDTINDLE
ncbi:MAG: DUF1998 domain-containing protein [Thaumarchaeota archaeon]|nr:DUF1998 domain-containing protein [Nitrososphaerota archaeon]